ncbi:MAG: DUF5626 family protein [Erysipelotrichaceae bacterium]|nr:DUF5626 family protein [Erysipelotrichaceae bacterium]
MKQIKLLFILTCLCGCLLNNVYAEDTLLSQKEKTPSYVFDLSLDRDQTAQFSSDDGLLTTISIVSSRSVSGEKTVSVTNSQISLSYKVYISGNSITNAYDKSYYSTYWNITSDVLTLDSSSQATYTVQCKRLLISTTKHLRATLNDGSLTVSYY